MAGRWRSGFLLAAAVGVVAASYAHYAIRTPNRTSWWLLAGGVALLAWPPAALLLSRVLVPTYQSLAPARRRVFAVVPLAFGVLIPRWWAGMIGPSLWVHGSVTRDVLGAVLAVAEVVVIAAAYASLLAVTVAAAGRGDDPPPAAPAPTRRWRVVVLAALFTVATVAFAVWFVGRERTLYHWDFIVYWTKAAGFAGQLRDGRPVEAWDQFRLTGIIDDYGPLPAAAPSVAMAALGDARATYIAVIAVLYLGLLAAACAAFVRRFAPAAGWLTFVVPALLVLLSPTAWGPVFRGYPDVGGAALAAAALLVFLSRPAGRIEWTRVVLLGALLAAAALYRRWYSFFVVAFFLIGGLNVLLAMAAEAVRGRWREAVRRGATFALVGVWAAAVLLPLAAVWVARVATTNYADDYRAYHTQYPFAHRAWAVADNLGYGVVAAAVLGAAVLLLFRDTRRVALVLVALPAVIVPHFLRTQDVNPHHMGLLLPSLLLLPALAACRLLAAAPAVVRVAGVIALAVPAGLAMAATFVPEVTPLHAALRPAVPAFVAHPMTRDDLPEFVRMVEAAAAAAGPTGKVAVVGSSPVISPTMVQLAGRSLGRPLLDPKRVAYTTEVDRNGGFPAGYFEADVVVSADPPQTHLRPEEQQTVVVTAESLRDGRDVGAAFDKLPDTFRLGGGVTASLYRRARPVPPAALAEYAARLRQAHPDRPRLFTPPDSISLLLARP